MRVKTFFAVVVAAAITVGVAGWAEAAIRSGFDSDSLAANDDDSTGLVNIGFELNLWGANYTQLYVNNNGNVTFDAFLSEYTPFDLSTTDRKIIAPFFADVDTTGTGSDVVQYGQGMVDGRNAFGVTYGSQNGVGYYDARTDKLNKFQVILIDRSDVAVGDFDIEFNYDQIQWETGDASDGVDGLGGDSARVGYSNGDDVSYELAGSAVNGAFLD